MGYLSDQPEWRAAYLGRIARMYERDKNCTCVVVWSLGNESGVGAAHEAGYRWLDVRDRSRRGGWAHGGGESIPSWYGLGVLFRLLRRVYRLLVPQHPIAGQGRAIQYVHYHLSVTAVSVPVATARSALRAC